MRILPSFSNEPLTDFSVTKNRTELEQAINQFLAEIELSPLTAYPIIDGAFITTGEEVVAHNAPSTGKICCHVHYSSVAQSNNALDVLELNQIKWADTSFEERACYLEQLATLISENKLSLTAQIIVEVGKTWKEADADVAEAIDFCRYYATYARFYGAPLITANLPGEENVLTYHPRGITTVIAPWNFPLAIACGMTVASLVAGNATVLKPAEQSSGIAFTLAKLILAAKIPAGVFALLPGRGEVIGRALIEDPRTATICFTGSRAVGLEILSLAAKVQSGQTRIKRVIAEMGGKNAIIVDNDADLDDVLRGVLSSAFGYAGQKCSACSRLIVVGQHTYEKLLDRLSEATKALIIGLSHNSDTFIGPVISKETSKSILDFIERARHTHKVVTIGSIPPDLTGFFVPPVVFCDVPEESPLWQEEIFGPVLACNTASSFKEAVAMANRSEYALTGSVYSRHPDHINYARRYFEVGNLYINRGSTGALVGRQPFGGFKMSGIGSKAGGPDYLLQFLEPRVTSENTTRKGFIPEID